MSERMHTDGLPRCQSDLAGLQCEGHEGHGRQHFVNTPSNILMWMDDEVVFAGVEDSLRAELDAVERKIAEPAAPSPAPAAPDLTKLVAEFSRECLHAYPAHGSGFILRADNDIESKLLKLLETALRELEAELVRLRQQLADEKQSHKETSELWQATTEDFTRAERQLAELVKEREENAKLRQIERIENRGLQVLWEMIEGKPYPEQYAESAVGLATSAVDKVQQENARLRSTLEQVREAWATREVSYEREVVELQFGPGEQIEDALYREGK